jgi:chitin synthase
MDWAQQSDDLTSYALNEDIKSVLKQRFSLQRPVTMIGAQSMLVLESVPTTIEQREEYHSQALQQSKGEATWLAPHSIQIVSNAFIEMLKTQQPQTISTWGNSGSGKSTTHEMLRTQLIEISPTKKKSKVLSGASKMESVLDAFGVYQSQTGPTSGYGRVTEYQYSKQGRMIGIKLLDYGLEKIRVSQVPGPECEKTFNIFYLVLCASELEKSEWELTDVTNFSYTKGVAQKQNTLSRKLTLSRSKSISRKPDPSQQENLSNTFELLKQNLKSLGIGKGLQKSLFKTIAAILHLGNLQFYDDDGKCLIKNQETLLICAKQLQVSPQELENTIIYKSKQIGKDTFSSMLTAKEAALNRDELTQCLYGLCFTYLIGHLNDRLCKDDHEVDCLLRLCDFPFIRQGSKLEIFVGNYMVEKMYNNMHSYQFDDYQLLLKQQGFVANEIKYLDNQVTVDLFDGTQRVPGLWKWLGADSNLDKLDEMLKPNPHYLQNSQCGVYSLKETKVYLFGVKHYINGPSIEYDLESFYQQDSSISDFVALFKKEEESFVGNLFSKTNGIIKVNGGESLMQTPMRKPSIKGNPVEKKEFKGIQSAVDNLLSSILKSKKWDIYCVNPLNDLKGYDDSKVEGQLVNLNIRELVQIKTLVDVDVDNAIGYDQFMTKYGSLVATFGASRGAGSTSIDAVNAFIGKQFWPKRHVFCGTQKLFLNQSRWRFLDHNLEKLDQENLQMHPELSPVVDQDWDKVRDSYYKDDEYSDGESQPESDYQYEQPKKDIETGDSKKNEHIQVTEDLTCTRKCWICCTWSLTWCIPGPFLNWCGGMKRGDIRMAWREKVALCIIIATLCGALLFFIVGLRFVICPPQKVLTHDEVRELRFPRFAKAPLQAHFAAYGQYYDATALMDSHKKSYGSVTGSQGIPDYIFEQFYGSDVSYLFNKVNAWEYYCPGIPRPLIPDYDNLDGNLAWQKRTNNIQGDIPGSNKYANVHSNKSPTGTPQLYASAMYKYSTGLLGWTVKSIETLSSTEKVLKIN